MLWTLADDAGRLRGSSRMLASLLYPYDSDAPRMIQKWLTELVSENCIVQYQVEGQHYLQISNWLSHQKIDHPSPSKFPEPPNLREDSRGFANDSGKFALDQGEDQGSRIRDQGEDKGSARAESPPPPVKTFPPALRIQESLILPIRKSFEYFNPQGFTAPALEDPAIVDLAEKFARLGRDDPGDFARAVLEKFHELTVSQDKFWRGQPYTPSSLNNPKIFDRVIAEMKTEEVQDERESWADMEIRLRAKMKAKEAV